MGVRGLRCRKAYPQPEFETWIPTFAAYSGTLLLYSIVETQLSAFAEYIGKKRGSRVRVKDMAGKGIDRSAHYLDLVLSIDVKKDPAWSHLRDLQSLRNFIMHSNGKRGDSQEHAIDDLVGRYEGKLEFRVTDGFGALMSRFGFRWISVGSLLDGAKNSSKGSSELSA